MTTTTLDKGPSRAELEVLLLAAAHRSARNAGAPEHRAQHVTDVLVVVLGFLAGVVAIYDVWLLLFSA